MALEWFVALVLAQSGVKVPTAPPAASQPLGASGPRRNLPQPLQTAISYVIEADGSASDCQMRVLTNAGVGLGPPFPNACPKPFRGPYLGKDGKPVRKRVTILNTFVIEDETP